MAQMFEVQPVGESIAHSVSVGPALERFAVLRRRLHSGQGLAGLRYRTQTLGVDGRVRIVADEWVVVVVGVVVFVLEVVFSIDQVVGNVIKNASRPLFPVRLAWAGPRVGEKPVPQILKYLPCDGG
jgi:hypothetical protein